MIHILTGGPSSPCHRLRHSTRMNFSIWPPLHAPLLSSYTPSAFKLSGPSDPFPSSSSLPLTRIPACPSSALPLLP